MIMSTYSSLQVDGGCEQQRQEQIAMHRERIALGQLVLSSFLFGVCFVAQKRAMGDGMSPITFTAARYVVSMCLLVITRPFLQKHLHSELDESSRTADSKKFSAQRLFYETMKWGSLCGLSSVVGSNLQQIGLVTVTAGKAAFYTAMYVIVVPIVEYFLPGFGTKLNWRVWLSAIVSVVGAYLLSGCATDSPGCFSSGSTHFGDLIVILSMFCWVFSIIACDVATNRGVDGVSFTVLEFFVCTVVTVILSRIFEPHAWDNIWASVSVSWSMVLLVGITEALSFLFSTLGQIYVDASKSAVIFSFESVVGAFGGYIFLGERLDTTELVGCFLMLFAVLFSTFDSLSRKEVHESTTAVAGIEIGLLPTKVPGTLAETLPQMRSSSGSSGAATTAAAATEKTRLVS